MGLPINKPNNDISYNEFKMLNDVVIRVRNYKIADIENYLKRVKIKDNETSLEKSTYALLRSCTHTDDIEKLDNLDRINIIYLIILLRVSSVSATIPYPHECVHCKTANLEHRMNILPLDVDYDNEKEIEFSDKFSIGLQNIPFSKELDIVEIQDKNERADLEFYYKIKWIRNDSEIYERKSFTIKEFKEWLSSDEDDYHLSNSQYLELISKMESFNEHIKINQKTNCVACGKELNLVMNNFTFFILA